MHGSTLLRRWIPFGLSIIAAVALLRRYGNVGQRIDSVSGTLRTAPGADRAIGYAGRANERLGVSRRVDASRATLSGMARTITRRTSDGNDEKTTPAPLDQPSTSASGFPLVEPMDDSQADTAEAAPTTGHDMPTIVTSDEQAGAAHP